MNKNFLITSVVAGITLFALGGIFYEFLLADFFKAAAPDGFFRDSPDYLFLILGELLTAVAITLAVVTWSGAGDFMAGLKAGAMFGLLIGLGFNLTFYGVSYMGDLSSTLADAVVTTIRFGITGGVAALMMTKLSGSDE